ncbi:MAG TPA: glycoside hydrolase family 20, partial [Opitutus sp.]|nr:glycoside hydrolase family 20 [Opitutus sp.]
KVHVGLDESFHLGKHPLSRREIAKIGLAAHFARYVKRLHALTQSLGLEMGLWADMFYFLPDAIPLLPKGLTAYEWYYHAFNRLPRVELFNFAEVDIATPLRARGAKLYGCPMNGAFRYEPLPHFGDRMNNIVAWWRHAQRIGAEGFLVSGWEPNRLAIELTTAVDAAAASLWLEPEVTDPRGMLARGFERAFGKKKGRAAANAALACDRYPFGGYPRWQINERWDAVSRREPLASYRRETRYFARLAADAERVRLAEPLRTSLGFRHYVAERDLCVRQAARGDTSALVRLGRLIASGRRAAAAMWNRTRDRDSLGPNVQMVQRDAARLKAARRGEPVFGGRWQLCYCVWNFAPAVQLVGVGQQQPDGSWQTLQSSHTIEFQTRSARRRADVVREHAAPVTWNGDRTQPPRLRIFVRGVGEVKIDRVALNGGSAAYPARGFARWRRVGSVAPTSGWPEFNWSVNREAIELSFAFR